MRLQQEYLLNLKIILSAELLQFFFQGEEYNYQFFLNMRNAPLAAAETIELSELAEAAIKAIETCIDSLNPYFNPNEYQACLIFLANTANRIQKDQQKVKEIFPNAKIEDFQNEEYVFQIVRAYEARLMAGG